MQSIDVIQIRRYFFSLPILALLVATRVTVFACSPYIEEHETTPAFRANTNAYEACPVSEETYNRIIREWLCARQQRSQITSIYLGRAVDYPWISRQIADNALVLIRKNGSVTKMTPKQRSDLESSAIKDAALLTRLATSFAGSSFNVTGISFEKVLYGKATDCSSQKDAGKMLVPYDAMLWIRLIAK